LLWLNKVSDDPIVRTTVIPTKLLNNQQRIPDKKEVSPSTSSENSDKEALPTPRFILQATIGTKALITINREPCQWFHTGDTLIDNYTLYNIDSTLVTIFDGRGAYYEISLNDAPMEEEFEANENTVAQDTPNTKGMIDLGDGQYISYGNKDVSGDTGEETFHQASQVVDTSDQTITYGTKDVDQDIRPEDEPPTLR
jgi:hypothetical protein